MITYFNGYQYFVTCQNHDANIARTIYKCMASFGIDLNQFLCFNKDLEGLEMLL